MDAIAARLGLDPVEVRRRNLIASREMPYARGSTRSAPRSFSIPATMRACSTRRWRAVEWEKLRKTLRRAKPPAKWSAPALRCSSRRAGLGRSIQVKIARRYRWQRGGDFRRRPRWGKASRRSIAQICADALGVDYRKIRVIHGQHRPHRIWARRLRVARHRDDRRGDADCRQRAESQGDRGRRPNCCRRRPSCST